MLTSDLKDALTTAKANAAKAKTAAEWSRFLTSAESSMKSAASLGFHTFTFVYQTNADKAHDMFKELGFETELKILRTKEYQVTPSW